MATVLARNLKILWLAGICALAVPSSALAATLWTGPMIAFTKAAFADPTIAANQDQITSSVWLTRAVNQGIYNAQSEAAYTSSTSPADTEWAWDLEGFNTGLEISAANWANLEFNDWETAHGGMTGAGPPGTVGIAGVLHLISEDIYLGIQFTDWGMHTSSGGTFSYLRDTNVPEPTTGALMAVALVATGAVRRTR